MLPLSNSFLTTMPAGKLAEVPRKQPIQGREAEICRRVREVRADTKLSRVAFASEVALDTAVLRRIEDARILLRYDVAWRIVNRWIVSAKWLATGEGGRWSRVAIPRSEALNLPVNALFSAVFDKLQAAAYAVGEGRAEEDSVQRRVRMQWVLHRLVEEWLIKIPDDKVDEFINTLTTSSREWMGQLPADKPENIEQRKSLLADRSEVDALSRMYRATPAIPASLRADTFGNCQNDLTIAGAAITVASDMSRWEELRRKLQPLLSGHGRKAALARELGLTRAAVSAWFKRKSASAPQGETLLQLQAWLAAEESKQQKSPANVDASAEPKTKPRTESKHETKTKSGRKKR